MSIKIKKLGSGDLHKFLELIRVFEDVFKMKRFIMPGQHYLQQLLEKDGFFVFVALLDEKVVGGLTSYTMMQYYSESPLVYVFDLAVKTEFQRKGIGKMLMSAIRDYCRDMGVEEVFVQADEEDDYAIEFYQSTGATGERVIQFYYR